MATKKIYLVDTENVGSTWKDLLPIKMGADQILLFFTENSPNVSYSDLQLILQFPDRFEMIKCNPGKNGLDFQLVSYLGYLLKTASKSNYVIVSNDNGFDAVVKFWQERGMSVSRMNVHHVLRQEDTARLKETASPAKTRTEPSAEKHGRAAQTARKTTLKRGRKPSGQPLADTTGNISDSADSAPESLADPDSANELKVTENLPENNSMEAFSDSQKEDMGNNGSITEIVTDRQNREPEFADSTEYPAVLENTDTVEDSPAIDADNTNGSSTFKNDAESLKNSGLAQDSDILLTAEDNRLSADADQGGNNMSSDLVDITDTAIPAPFSQTADTIVTPIACTPETAAPTDIEISQEEEQAVLIPAQGEETEITGTKPAAKRKSTRTARTAPRRKPAPDGAETQAQTKKRKRASGAPLAQPIEPAFPDTENMELDFSNLTVSEKAALLRKYLPKEFCENQESFEIVSDIMFGHDTTNHHQLHLAFVKSFGDEKGTLIYKAFRPHLAEFRA